MRVVCPDVFQAPVWVHVVDYAHLRVLVYLWRCQRYPFHHCSPLLCGWPRGSHAQDPQHGASPEIDTPACCALYGENAKKYLMLICGLR